MSTHVKRLKPLIESAWEIRGQLSPDSAPDVIRAGVDKTLDALDSGEVRVAEKKGDIWIVHQWLKKAVLLSFRIRENTISASGLQHQTHGAYSWYDKIPMKFSGWNEASLRGSGLRMLPGSFVRRSAYLAPGVILMPCFINMGARIESGTMVDTWTTVGSCAQIGKNVHLSGGVGIGGVLEPLQANPVIIEDNCFIGARSEVAEGVIIEQGAVLSMGVYLGASTRIVDRETGVVSYGRVPAWSVVVPGMMLDDSGNKKRATTLLEGPAPIESRSFGLYCAVIVKRVDEKTRSRVSINELLRS